jgi:hypothetical protein
MNTDAITTAMLRLGKAQIDVMFQRVYVHVLDDSEFIPMLEVVLTAFETVGMDKMAV